MTEPMAAQQGVRSDFEVAKDIFEAANDPSEWDYDDIAAQFWHARDAKVAELNAEIERLKKTTELHNDSAVEAWKLTREWQTCCQRLEAEVSEKDALIAELGQQLVNLKAGFEAMARATELQPQDSEREKT